MGRNALVKEVKFRNYEPRQAELRDENADEAAAIAAGQDDEAERQMAELVSRAKEKLNDDVLNIAPKNANWDLRRDIEPKLKILEQQTQKAMAELQKRKLEEEEEESSEGEEDSSEEDND